MRKLINEYTQLLERAEQTTDRREAIRCIRESTKIRELMAIHNGHSLRGA